MLIIELKNFDYFDWVDPAWNFVVIKELNSSSANNRKYHVTFIPIQETGKIINCRIEGYSLDEIIAKLDEYKLTYYFGSIYDSKEYTL